MQTIRSGRQRRGGEHRNEARGSNRRGEKSHGRRLNKKEKEKKKTHQRTFRRHDRKSSSFSFAAVPAPREDPQLVRPMREVASVAEPTAPGLPPVLVSRGVFWAGNWLSTRAFFRVLLRFSSFFSWLRAVPAESENSSAPLSSTPSPLPQADARLCIVRVAPKGSWRWASSPAGPVAAAAHSSALPIVGRCIFALLLLRSCSRQRKLREERVHSLFSPATGSDSMNELSAGAEIKKTKKPGAGRREERRTLKTPRARFVNFEPTCFFFFVLGFFFFKLQPLLYFLWPPSTPTSGECPRASLFILCARDFLRGTPFSA